MTGTDFNDMTAQADYTYRHNPVSEHSFLILKREDQQKDYVHIGEYNVLDLDEDRDLSEKKVMNIISALNGRENLMDLGEGTGKRTLFHPIQRKTPLEKSKIIFHTLEQEGGVSKENAILTILEDLEDDRTVQ